MKCYNAAYRANRTAKKLGLEGVITIEDVEEVFQARTCFYCGIQTIHHEGVGPRAACLTLDHRVSLTNGGTNTRDNLVASCHACNVTKGVYGLHPEQWSQKYDQCVTCGTTDRPHEARGMCLRCYCREYDRAHPQRHDNYRTQGKRVHSD